MPIPAAWTGGRIWGGDTAAQVVASLGAQGRRVGSLVTIDPVGRGISADFLARVRRGTREWANVSATGGSPANLSDLIARIGGAYGQAPNGHADRSAAAPLAHEAFAAMFRLRLPGGVSAEDIAAGRGTPK